MYTSITRILASTAVAAAAAIAVGAAPAVAQKRQPIERLEANAVNLSNIGPADPHRVDIVIERWSSEHERDDLIGTLREKGPDALLRQLQKLPRVGFIQRVGGRHVGWDLHFARERKLEDGGRQIIIATDRPIGFREAATRPRSIDYAFTLIDIRFDGDGKGVGKLAVASKVYVDEKTGNIEIENFSSEPVRLTDVRSTAGTRTSPSSPSDN
jgi:hypothetical protein